MAAAAPEDTTARETDLVQETASGPTTVERVRTAAPRAHEYQATIKTTVKGAVCDDLEWVRTRTPVELDHRRLLDPRQATCGRLATESEGPTRGREASSGSRRRPQRRRQTTGLLI